jgi:hypothetical protein
MTEGSLSATQQLESMWGFLEVIESQHNLKILAHPLDVLCCILFQQHGTDHAATAD